MQRSKEEIEDFAIQSARVFCAAIDAIVRAGGDVERIMSSQREMIADIDRDWSPEDAMAYHIAYGEELSAVGEARDEPAPISTETFSSPAAPPKKMDRAAVREYAERTANELIKCDEQGGNSHQLLLGQRDRTSEILSRMTAEEGAAFAEMYVEEAEAILNRTNEISERAAARREAEAAGNDVAAKTIGFFAIIAIALAIFFVLRN